LVAEVLRRAGQGNEAGLTVAFVPTGEMAELNERYRGIQGPTEVLSFPAAGGEDEGWPAEHEGPEAYLGDVVLCPQYAAGNAAAEGLTLDQELRRLIVHGVLHLLGHDHETDQGEMLALQERLLHDSPDRPLLAGHS
jgi:probable rRNA maturation factor